MNMYLLLFSSFDSLAYTISFTANRTLPNLIVVDKISKATLGAKMAKIFVSSIRDISGYSKVMLIILSVCLSASL
jgi:sulfate adenylyltransferase subunit 1 (EFTu-like GTPase family)